MPSLLSMSPVFITLALLTLAGAAGAMALRNLVHCALCAAVSFLGIGLLFLQLGAEFVGLAQILVYVGAIAILIVFTILLIRSAEAGPAGRRPVGSWLAGLLVAAAALGCMLAAILRSPSLVRSPEAAPRLAVKSLGDRLMSTYVVPLEVVGLLLTAVLIGAVVLALQEKRK